MPVYPKIAVTILPWCNLGQAMQWLTHEIKPVNRDAEAVLRIQRYAETGGLQKEKSLLFGAFCAGRIRLFGCRGLGKAEIIDFDHIYFFQYGEQEEVPVQKISGAGLDGFHFESSRLTKIIWADPMTGWEYRELVMPTEELLKTFPSDHDGPVAEPPLINLMGLSDLRTGPRPRSLAEFQGARIGQIEIFNTDTNQTVPDIINSGLILPPYLKFMVWILEKLGPNTIASLKKADLDAAIKELWWDALGPPSNVHIRYMAMMLRPPEAKRGGAKPRRKPVALH